MMLCWSWICTSSTGGGASDLEKRAQPENRKRQTTAITQVCFNMINAPWNTERVLAVNLRGLKPSDNMKGKQPVPHTQRVPI
jgi:hypothetical protein